MTNHPPHTQNMTKALAHLLIIPFILALWFVAKLCDYISPDWLPED